MNGRTAKQLRRQAKMFVDSTNKEKGKQIFSDKDGYMREQNSKQIVVAGCTKAAVKALKKSRKDK
jgi:hypothetical protein